MRSINANQPTIKSRPNTMLQYVTTKLETHTIDTDLHEPSIQPNPVSNKLLKHKIHPVEFYVLDKSNNNATEQSNDHKYYFITLQRTVSFRFYQALWPYMFSKCNVHVR